MRERIILMLLLISAGITGINGQATEQPSGTLSGLFFIDYYYNILADEAIGSMPDKVLKGARGVNGFQIRRIYLTYDYRLNSKLSSRIRLESDEANFTSNLAGDRSNKFGMFVKDAYVKWNYFGSHNVYLGIQGTPGFEISERVWGNRYIEKTIMDLRGVCPSRDLGIAFRGNIDSPGIFKYWFLFANGNAGQPESDKYKRYYANLEVTPYQNYSVTLFADYQSKESFISAFAPGVELNNNIFTGAILVGYRKRDQFSCGIEAYYRKAENSYELTDGYVAREGFGYSLFATWYLLENLNTFIRYDRLEPNRHELSSGDRRDLYIAGLAYKHASNFTIAPNIFVETHEKQGSQEYLNSVAARLTVNWTF